MDRSGDIQLRVGGRGRARGFTLIELMVVAVIVAILMAIAVPSYAIFMKKSRRGSAESILMDIAQREQQYLIDARAYAPDIGTLFGIPNPIPVDVSSYYNVQICQTTAGACNPPGGAPPTFAVIATPIAGSPQAGDPVLTIDNTGAKTPANVW
jgi:type IV pilus assembly protein PilE